MPTNLPERKPRRAPPREPWHPVVVGSFGILAGVVVGVVSTNEYVGNFFSQLSQRFYDQLNGISVGPRQRLNDDECPSFTPVELPGKSLKVCAFDSQHMIFRYNGYSEAAEQAKIYVQFDDADKWLVAKSEFPSSETIANDVAALLRARIFTDSFYPESSLARTSDIHDFFTESADELLRISHTVSHAPPAQTSFARFNLYTGETVYASLPADAKSKCLSGVELKYNDIDGAFVQDGNRSNPRTDYIQVWGFGHFPSSAHILAQADEVLSDQRFVDSQGKNIDPQIRSKAHDLRLRLDRRQNCPGNG